MRERERERVGVLGKGEVCLGNLKFHYGVSLPPTLTSNGANLTSNGPSPTNLIKCPLMALGPNTNSGPSTQSPREINKT